MIKSATRAAIEWPRGTLRLLRHGKIRLYCQEHFGTRGAPLPIAVDFQRALRATPQPDVLMFGDSVSLRVARQDKDKRTLGEMACAALSPLNVHVTAFSAYTAYMHGAFLALARAMSAEPGWVVLPFNLRCLSPQWDASPIWQYTQENAVVRALANDPQAVPGAVAPVYLDERVYAGLSVSSPLTPKRTLGELRRLAPKVPGDEATERERLRDLLTLHYGSPVAGSHRQLACLTGAVREALALKARVLVYLTPINMQLIEGIWGGRLLAIVEDNRRLVRAALEAAGASDAIVFADWSDALGSDQFFHERETTEHLAEAGRLRIAALIAGKITAAEFAATPRRARQSEPPAG